MTEEMITARLRTLSEDIAEISEEAKKELIYYCEASGEREQIIKDMYAKDFAPVKTSAPTGFSNGAHDRLMLYEEFVDGYSRYLDNTLKEYRKHISRKEEARRLLTYIMSLPGVCTRVIYMAYVRKMPIEDVCKSLYMSKSTFYRYRKLAIQLLTMRYNESDNNEKMAVGK